MKHKRFRGVAILTLLSVILTACSIPVPNDKQDYVGVWEGRGMTLEMSADGRVEYERVEGSLTKGVSGQLQSFEGDDFVVGVWFLKTTFEVQRTPYQDDGEWKMVVDGVELVRCGSRSGV